ncbi:uncharacterized protein [Cherax quadricarinatus]
MNQNKLALLQWQDAVQEEGQRVMYQVTTRLYQGKNLRPDYYWVENINSNQAYKKYFNNDQRQILESFHDSQNYDIEIAAREFDISLHWAVQQKFCKLNRLEVLYGYLERLVNMRNTNSHRSDHSGIPTSDLKEQLEELLKLCLDILSNLEDRTSDDLSSVKRDIRNSINKRLLMLPKSTPAQRLDDGAEWMHRSVQRMDNSDGWMHRSVQRVDNTDGWLHHRADTARTHHSTTMSQRVADEEDDGLGTLGKVAVGVGVAGVGIVALGALADYLSEKNKNGKQSNRNSTSTSNKNDDCSIM